MHARQPSIDVALITKLKNVAQTFIDEERETSWSKIIIGLSCARTIIFFMLMITYWIIIW